MSNFVGFDWNQKVGKLHLFNLLFTLIVLEL